jgi:dihydrolipoamide dehydrogenase
MTEFSLIVVGGGPAGYSAAIRAAQLGARVALIEQDQVGGTCLNRGCIPTKALIACTNFYARIQRAGTFGIKTGNVAIDLAEVVERKNKIVAKLIKGVEQLLKGNKIELFRGTACVTAPGEIELTGDRRHVTGDKLVLATGSVPASLLGAAFDHQRILCSDDLLNQTELPASLEIVGGGVIGLHFAQIFSSLGTKVTIHELLPEILPGVDEEIVQLVKRQLKRKKVEVLTNTRFDPAQTTGPILVCIGRQPDLSGLAKLELKMAGQQVWVNEYQETSLSGVYAAGDLCSQKLLAHVASEQGVIAAENALGAKKPFVYDHVPYGIYTDPEIGAVGLTESEARARFGEIKVGKFPLAALGIAQALGETEGLVKVISGPNNRLLGVHIIGAEAATLIGSATQALKNGLTLDQLAATFQAHPSFPEGLQEAALAALKRSLNILNS